MTTAYSTNLELALPVQGELSGTWGNTVNNGITQYLDAAIAGSQIISGSQTAVTLTNTNGDDVASNIAQAGSGATGTAQYQIIRCTGNPASLLTITISDTGVAGYSKTFIIINATSTSQSVKIVGSGPTTGITVASGAKSLVAWNGSDFVEIASSTADGVTSFTAGTTGFTPNTSTTGAVTLAGTLNVANGGTGVTTSTGTGSVVLSTSPTLVTPALGTPSSGTVTNLTGTASININGTVGATTPNTGAFTTLSATSTITSTSYGTFKGLRIGLDGGNDIFNGSSANTYYSTSTNSYGHVFGNSSGGTYCQFNYTSQIFYSSNVERARVQAGFSVGTTADPGAGAIYATGNITAYYSDERLKTVSGKIENALDKVAKLSGVYYTNNDTAKSFGYDSVEVQVGVLAQEVEAVLPQIVKAAPFDLDADGNSKSGQNYKTVQYERLVPLLIEAINELRAEVKALEAK